MKYRLAIFDFDGTLADSFPFFVSVFNGVAAQHGFKTLESGEAERLRHLDARQLMTYLGLPAWKLPMVSRSFMALMKRNAARISLFDGIADALCELSGKGVVLAVVSSNSAENVREILGPELCGLVSRLECGMSVFGKAGRIRKVLQASAVPAREAIYVGDQATDREAARTARVAFGAVGWGYGTMESLMRHQPEEVFDSVGDLRQLA